MASSPREDALTLLQHELAPYPGRLHGAMRDTLGILIAVVLGMTLRVSGMSLALALLYLMQRERPGLTLKIGLQIFAGSVVACLFSFFWVQATDSTEVARFMGLLMLVFGSAFCMVSTSIPLFWTILGFYGFVDLSLWDSHRSPNAIVTAALYNVAALGLVILSAVAVEYMFGTRHPAEDLDHEFRKRVIRIRDYFRELALSPAGDSANIVVHRRSIIQLAHAGDSYLNELYSRLRSSEKASEVPLGINYRIGLLIRVLNGTVGYGFNLPKLNPEKYAPVYQQIAQLCDDILEGRTVSIPEVSEGTPTVLREILRTMTEYGNSLQKNLPRTPDTPTEVEEKPKEETSVFSQLFLPGVFDTPDAVFYALKLTLAAMTCYIIYNAIAWPGILTCVVTVIFTGLNSTGAMKQKQLYRVSGAAIGGALAIFTVSVLYPNMDSITSLVMVVAPIAILAGWVTRSPHIGYVGVQIGFGFFLTALPTFGASTQLTPARDRVVGIALGILVMWFIFDQVWPVRTTDALRESLNRIKKATVELRQLLRTQEGIPDNRAFQRLRSAVSLELVNVHQLEFSANFEVGRHRKREMARTRRLIDDIEQSSAEFYAVASQY